MKKAKKILTLVACAVLLVCISVGATIAYLTATTNTVQNTFTVGKVHFGDEEDLTDGLDEAKVNEYGEPIEGADRVKGNTYKLLPGHTYTKDPTVTIGKESEPAYVRMFVKITDLADVKAVLGAALEGSIVDGKFLPQYFVGGWDNSVWQTTGEIVEADNAAVYEFWYVGTELNDEGEVGIVDALDAEKVMPALFTSITVPEGVINDDLKKLEDMDIQVVAQAVQADGFASQEAAWAEIADPAFDPAE